MRTSLATQLPFAAYGIDDSVHRSSQRVGLGSGQMGQQVTADQVGMDHGRFRKCCAAFCRQLGYDCATIAD